MFCSKELNHKSNSFSSTSLHHGFTLLPQYTSHHLPCKRSNRTGAIGTRDISTSFFRLQISFYHYLLWIQDVKYKRLKIQIHGLYKVIQRPCCHKKKEVILLLLHQWSWQHTLQIPVNKWYLAPTVSGSDPVQNMTTPFLTQSQQPIKHWASHNPALSAAALLFSDNLKFTRPPPIFL